MRRLQRLIGQCGWPGGRGSVRPLGLVAPASGGCEGVWGVGWGGVLRRRCHRRLPAQGRAARPARPSPVRPRRGAAGPCRPRTSGPRRSSGASSCILPTGAVRRAGPGREGGRGEGGVRGSSPPCGEGACRAPEAGRGLSWKRLPSWAVPDGVLPSTHRGERLNPRGAGPAAGSGKGAPVALGPGSRPCAPGRCCQAPGPHPGGGRWPEPPGRWGRHSRSCPPGQRGWAGRRRPRSSGTRPPPQRERLTGAGEAAQLPGGSGPFPSSPH